MEVAESVLPPGLDVVIGMDIITRGDFAVTNLDGKTTFSFRIPSLADIDFVQDDNAANQKALVLQRQSKPSEQKRQAIRRKRKKKGKR